MKANKKGSPFSFGALSVMTVLLVLILAAFAMLSYVNARNDYALSQKTADSVTAYYEADGRAEQLAARAAELIAAGDFDSLYAEGFDYDGRNLSYSVPINQKMLIFVKIDTTGGFRCLEWAVKTTEEQS